MDEQRIEGRVTKLVADKGYGFVRGDDRGEYFIHRSQVPDFDALRENQRVSFAVQHNEKGPRAIDVETI